MEGVARASPLLRRARHPGAATPGAATGRLARAGVDGPPDSLCDASFARQKSIGGSLACQSCKDCSGGAGSPPPPVRGEEPLWRSTGASGRPGRRRTVGGTRGYPRNAPARDPLTVGPMKQIDFDRSMTIASSHSVWKTQRVQNSRRTAVAAHRPELGHHRPPPVPLGPRPRPQGDRVLPISQACHLCVWFVSMQLLKESTTPRIPLKPCRAHTAPLPDFLKTLHDTKRESRGRQYTVLPSVAERDPQARPEAAR